MDNIETPVFKRIDDPWIALLVVGIFIFLSSIITIIVLCLLWRRHKQRTKLNNKNYILNNNSNNIRQIPIQIDNRRSIGYETQKMELFVPQGEDEKIQKNFGEIHARFTPEDGIQEMHEFYQRTNKAYF